jgi:hypothetical protein
MAIKELVFRKYVIFRGILKLSVPQDCKSSGAEIKLISYIMEKASFIIALSLLFCLFFANASHAQKYIFLNFDSGYFNDSIVIKIRFSNKNGTITDSTIFNSHFSEAFYDSQLKNSTFAICTNGFDRISINIIVNNRKSFSWQQDIYKLNKSVRIKLIKWSDNYLFFHYERVKRQQEKKLVLISGERHFKRSSSR